MNAPLLQIEGATVYRGRTCVFENFSLAIGQGENVAILGPNGSGKTTLLQLLTRDIYPVADRGHVRLLGRERFHIDDLRRHIGMVSHDLGAAFLSHDYPGLKPVREVVLSGLINAIGLHAMFTEFEAGDEARADSLIAQLGLTEHAQTPLARLSTGQQRRALLARALVHQPAALILDEPSAGLDLPSAFVMQKLLAELMAAGTQLVLVTHHVNEIPSAVERVVLLREGRVIADGPRETVLTEPTLSELYGVPVRLVRSGQDILARPGD